MSPDERLLALLDEIAENTEVGRTQILLENYLQQIREAMGDGRIQVDTTELEKVLNRLPLFPSEEQIAQAVANIVTIPPQIDFTPTLNEVLQAILSLKQTMRDVAGGGRNMAGGTGIVRMEEGQVVEVANDTGNPLSTSVSNFPASQAVTSSTLATESTLNALLDATANVEDAVHAEVANIVATTWTTVVSYTPPAPATVLGFNADISSLTDIIYRMRLQVNGVVKCSETIGASANSWIPIKTDVPAGQLTEVQVFHGEVTAQTFRASLSYGT